MRKLLLLLSITSVLGLKSQTAVNFNCNDCNNVNHDFFTELNSGKVVVLCWVMPCANCVGPATTALNIVQSYSASNPGKVLFYLCDDYGTTSCLTLNNWATSNGMSGYTAFSNSVIAMSDYGANGMPKLVVVGGGTNHTVFDNQITTLNASTFSIAINNAIASSPTGLRETSNAVFKARVSPNPSPGDIQLNWNTLNAGKFNVEIYSANGALLKQIEHSANAGDNHLKLNTDGLSSGIYFVKIGEGKNAEIIKFILNH